MVLIESEETLDCRFWYVGKIEHSVRQPHKLLRHMQQLRLLKR